MRLPSAESTTACFVCTTDVFHTPSTLILKFLPENPKVLFPLYSCPVTCYAYKRITKFRESESTIFLFYIRAFKTEKDRGLQNSREYSMVSDSKIKRYS